MRINRLRIDNFRNLKNFEISFTVSGTDADGQVQTFNSYAVIGQNGSGKSNLLAAVIAIFRDLDLESVLFALKRPYWFGRNPSGEMLSRGDNRFWYARGKVKTFLARLWEYAVAPIDCEESRTLDFRDRKEKFELLYLFLPDDPSLIAFDEEGKAIPSPSCQSDWEKERAEFTIARLKLSEHERLTEARKKIWQTVTMEIEQYQTAKAKLALGCNPGVKEKVKAHLKKIRAMVSPTSELSSVAKWCVHFRNDDGLLKLVF